MTEWLLNLFPAYRTVRECLRRASESNGKLLESNQILVEQNTKLTEEIRSARNAQIEALQSIANVRIQIELGGMPPYPNSYHLPPAPERTLGPIEPNRVQGRDMVRAGTDEFLTHLRSL